MKYLEKKQKLKLKNELELFNSEKIFPLYGI
jgi:hypothetical protein